VRHLARSGKVVWLVGALFAGVLAGCNAVETRIQPSLTSAQPGWIMTPKEPGQGMRYYVGISIAENVLEEQQGRRRALANAAELVSQSIVDDVTAKVTETDSTEGPAHLGSERKKEWTREELETVSKESIRFLAPKEYYYEQWRITDNWLERLFNGGHVRYKYYVLTAYPEVEYQRLVEKFQGETE